MDLGRSEDTNTDQESDTSSRTFFSFSDQNKIIFDGTKPLVLDLYSLERTKAKVDSGMSKLKKKVRRKRKSVERSKKTQSSSSSSNASLKKTTKRNEQLHDDAHETLSSGVPASSPVCAKSPPNTSKKSPGLSITDNETPTKDPVCKRVNPAK